MIRGCIVIFDIWAVWIGIRNYTGTWSRPLVDYWYCDVVVGGHANENLTPPPVIG